jgi:hypothetical protein
MRACSTPARRLAPALLGIGVLFLGACTSAAADMTPVTVTVYPTKVAATAEPTPIPTEYAGSPAAGPTSTGLAVGSLEGAPAGFDEALARVEGAEIAEAVQGFFVSPTGNILCKVIRDGSAMACELAEGRVPAPDVCPPDGPAEVRRLELDADRVVAACSGSIRGEGEGAPKLRYGRRTVVAGTPIQCLSEKVGVTCIDTVGRRGFFVAKGSFAIF